MEVSVLIIFCRVGLLAVSVDDTRALATVVYAPVVAAVPHNCCGSCALGFWIPAPGV